MAAWRSIPLRILTNWRRCAGGWGWARPGRCSRWPPASRTPPGCCLWLLPTPPPPQQSGCSLSWNRAMSRRCGFRPHSAPGYRTRDYRCRRPDPRPTAPGSTAWPASRRYWRRRPPEVMCCTRVRPTAGRSAIFSAACMASRGLRPFRHAAIPSAGTGWSGLATGWLPTWTPPTGCCWQSS